MSMLTKTANVFNYLAMGQQTLESVLDICSPRTMVCPCDSQGVNIKDGDWSISGASARERA
jgi:hypothetical protein